MPQDRTDEQKAASRANGLKSHGPKTARGKTRSSLNSLKHGLVAHSLILPNESRRDYNELASALGDLLNPQDRLEKILVQRIVAAQWRLQRVKTFERVAMIHAADAATDVPPTVTAEGTWHEPAARDAVAFEAVHGKAGSGSVYQLSESRYQRQFAQALSQFYTLRRLKNEERT